MSEKPKTDDGIMEKAKPMIDKISGAYSTEAEQKNVKASLESLMEGLNKDYNLDEVLANAEKKESKAEAKENVATPERESVRPAKATVQATKKRHKQELRNIRAAQQQELREYEERLKEYDEYGTSDHLWAGAGAATVGAGLAGAELVSNLVPAIASATQTTKWSAILGGAISPSMLTSAGMGIAGAGALYGMGRLHEKVWGLPKAGFLTNAIPRAVMSPVSVPLGLLWHGGKFMGRNAKQTAKGNWNAIPKMFKGESPGVKAATAPFWWPIRSAKRALWNGIPNGWNETGFKQSKGMSKIGYPIGKLAKAPFRAGKWLLSSPNSSA